MSNPFNADDVAEMLAHEAVFQARNPQLLLRSDQHLISFRDGEYRTSDPAEIEFLLGVVGDEARGNRGVTVRQLPRDWGEAAETGEAEIAAPAKESKRKALRKGAGGENNAI